MSGCCNAKTGAECAAPQREASTCPGCAAKARSVATLTVKSLVRDHTRLSAEGSYWFCRQPECDVVYFSEHRLFRKSDLKVRVGIKEHEDPIPLCYCFDYTRADIRRDIETLGKSEIPERIKAEVQAGFCACEVKNPSGNCCLGDVNRAVKEKESERMSVG